MQRLSRLKNTHPICISISTVCCRQTATCLGASGELRSLLPGRLLTLVPSPSDHHYACDAEHSRVTTIATERHRYVAESTHYRHDASQHCSYCPRSCCAICQLCHYDVSHWWLNTASSETGHRSSFAWNKELPEYANRLWVRERVLANSKNRKQDEETGQDDERSVRV